MTIGIVAGRLLRRQGRRRADATMTSTLSRTSSAASSGSRSALPSAYRYSIDDVLALDVAQLAQALPERVADAAASGVVEPSRE